MQRPSRFCFGGEWSQKELNFKIVPLDSRTFERAGGEKIPVRPNHGRR